MRRFWRVLPLLPLLLSACQIEQTPAEYIDVVEIPQDEIGASREELTDRLRSTASALQRRNLNDLLTALTPAEDVQGFGPELEAPVEDATSLAYALATTVAGRPVAMRDLQVDVGPENNVAWFQAAYELGDLSGGAAELRFSGVFLRQEGEWRLVQGHVSPPITPESPPEAQADTLAGAG